MATKLFVGSLSWNVKDDDLSQFFASAGTVVSASVITDRDTGRSKGFGFVEMSSDDEAKKAIDELNGKELDGRPITVNEARPREERPRNNFGGGGDRGGNRY
jgi:RNA recognition motif-containing protein